MFTDFEHQYFQWIEPGELVDGDLRLELSRRNPADPVRKWVPSYTFSMTVGGEYAGRYVNLLK
jgi:hypothetical protein